MRADQILARTARRMWRVHVPGILILLVGFCLAQGGSGLATVLALLAFIWVLAACADWATAEGAATRAEREH